MILVLNWITIILSTTFMMKSIKKVTNGNYSILHLCVIVFWIMQVMPLLLENIIGINDGMKVFSTMYLAMTDENVGIIYDFIVIVITILLYILGNKLFKKYKKKVLLREWITHVSLNRGIQLLLYFGMFVLPFFAIMLSPNPRIYSKFAYFYTETGTLSERLFHQAIMTYVDYIAFGCTILRYLYRSDTRIRKNIDVVAAIILFTWIDQKRALFTFALIGILAIDVIRQSYRSRGQLVCKAIMFGIVTITFFVVYSIITGKGGETNFSIQYTMYYSRMNCVKTVIYDRNNDRAMLEYTGQTILYNLLFFIPRKVWPNKPVMFCKYFTAYSMGRSSLNFLNWNLHVNIWTEFLANFGYIGIAIAIGYVVFVAIIIENSDNLFVYLFGTVYIVFYFMFGFETLTVISYSLWIGGLLITNFYKGLKISIKR